jgi:hypothetical protein
MISRRCRTAHETSIAHIQLNCKDRLYTYSQTVRSTDLRESIVSH